MTYQSMRECVEDLDRNGHLLRISQPVESNLVMAQIQRRVYQAQGPAILFERPGSSQFPCVSNVFGSMERAKFIFRHQLEAVQFAIECKANPAHVISSPKKAIGLAATGFRALPMEKFSSPVLEQSIKLSQLPQITSWPDDGGPFITLPQVFSQDPASSSILKSNLGMYRVQIAGNDYVADSEVGLHFQIHRGIADHYHKAAKAGQDLPVSIFVGGPPAHTLAAVMPLPEGMSELSFAGMLSGRRFRYQKTGQHIVSSDADFCIRGKLKPYKTKEEGPFGDHLGYYSLRHEFPVLEVEAVNCRKDAIWPFTVVGRPPQEDTVFGSLIHELAGPMVPASLPGLLELNAVDAAGVHPLLLAIGKERYVPFQEKKEARELLTIANSILGFGQASLAKYLFIVAQDDQPNLKSTHEEAFFEHVLERVDWAKDIHFHSKSTIDTLDYSGTGLNEGSKAVIAVAGAKKRKLKTKIPANLSSKIENLCGTLAIASKGILAIEGPAKLKAFPSESARKKALREWCQLVWTELQASPEQKELLQGFPLWVLVDNADFCAKRFDNLLWTCFTRSNPATDVFGLGEDIIDKHWHCKGPLLIDARVKEHHAPPLEEDPEVTKIVDSMATRGEILHSVLGKHE